ncbi:helix-turn-helix domain-containing protein [Mycolicibacterium grossiae]|uniref:DNA-binding protein n=1 Tax=Mycolicibacterium grossiae TaxID=1552759 RepID=A0A1E8PW44_9MYCO|nr:helix-turn-helix domain-containing protein [Mycolicibacterium grossiae]OFJ50533.1 DNA-binding protein [Mycolicibacterium grossiae]QEM45675.1 helix-turn-helix domain-containing protein [Mycolicibacterium grossiae]
MSWKALDWSIAVEVETPLERLVLMLLANRADGTFSCYPSQRTLVTETCAARSTVLKVLGKLENDRLIVRVARHHDSGARRSNLYLLNHPDAPHLHPTSALGHPQSEQTAGPVRLSHRGGPQSVRQGVRCADPLNLQEEPQAEPSSVSLLNSLPAPWRVSGEDARKLVPAIEAAFAAGWSSQTLVDHLASRPEGVRSPAAVLRRRLSELPAPPPFAPRGRTPWCGECEDPLSRTISITQLDGTQAAAFCPRCSPQKRQTH